MNIPKRDTGRVPDLDAGPLETSAQTAAMRACPLSDDGLDQEWLGPITGLVWGSLLGGLVWLFVIMFAMAD
jgi:hypothetical protein